MQLDAYNGFSVFCSVHLLLPFNAVLPQLQGIKVLMRSHRKTTAVARKFTSQASLHLQ